MRHGRAQVLINIVVAVLLDEFARAGDRPAAGDAEGGDGGGVDGNTDVFDRLAYVFASYRDSDELRACVTTLFRRVVRLARSGMAAAPRACTAAAERAELDRAELTCRELQQGLLRLELIPPMMFQQADWDRHVARRGLAVRRAGAEEETLGLAGFVSMMSNVLRGYNIRALQQALENAGHSSGLGDGNMRALLHSVKSLAVSDHARSVYRQPTALQGGLRQAAAAASVSAMAQDLERLRSVLCGLERQASRLLEPGPAAEGTDVQSNGRSPAGPVAVSSVVSRDAVAGGEELADAGGRQRPAAAGSQAPAPTVSKPPENRTTKARPAAGAAGNSEAGPAGGQGVPSEKTAVTGNGPGNAGDVTVNAVAAAPPPPTNAAAVASAAAATTGSISPPSGPGSGPAGPGLAEGGAGEQPSPPETRPTGAVSPSGGSGAMLARSLPVVRSPDVRSLAVGRTPEARSPDDGPTDQLLALISSSLTPLRRLGEGLTGSPAADPTASPLPDFGWPAWGTPQQPSPPQQAPPPPQVAPASVGFGAGLLSPAGWGGLWAANPSAATPARRILPAQTSSPAPTAMGGFQEGVSGFFGGILGGLAAIGQSSTVPARSEPSQSLSRRHKH